MDAQRESANLQREVERVFGEMGWENVEWLESWDGQELDELRKILTEEQYQTLLDELQDLEDRA